MAGKRKREDNVGEGEGMELNGNDFAELQARFHEWLLDILEILREWVLVIFSTRTFRVVRQYC